MFAENPAVYRIIWKYIAETGRPEMTKKYNACALHAG
jgi:hypothetical protein